MLILVNSHRTLGSPYLHALPCSIGLSFVLVAQGIYNFVKARVRFLNRRKIEIPAKMVQSESSASGIGLKSDDISVKEIIYT
jgi:hypothetical protein